MENGFEKLIFQAKINYNNMWLIIICKETFSYIIESWLINNNIILINVVALCARVYIIYISLIIIITPFS